MNFSVHNFKIVRKHCPAQLVESQVYSYCMQSLQYFSDMPTAPSTGYKVIVTTRNAGGTAIDGPTASNGFSMKQIGSGQIADGIITSIKPAKRFMKRVTVFDTPGGNAAGWNPDGSTVTFAIQIQIPKGIDNSFINAEAQVPAGSTNFFCETVRQSPGGFRLTCSIAPPNGAELHYVLENLPGHAGG